MDGGKQEKSRTGAGLQDEDGGDGAACLCSSEAALTHTLAGEGLIRRIKARLIYMLRI